MKTRDWYDRLVLGLAIVAVASGCSEPSYRPTISGMFSFHGEPIVDATLMFFPEQGSAIAARTDDSGRYTVDLTPGQYKVTVNLGVQLPPGWKEGDPVPARRFGLPQEYSTRINTPLTTIVTVTGAEPTNFDLP